MTAIVHTDIPCKPYRRLTKKYDLTAGTKGGGNDAPIGTGAPNTLNNNLPNVADAMGKVPDSGIVHFVHDGAVAVDITAYYWSAHRNRVTDSKGWIAAGEASSINTKSVDGESGCSIKLPPKCPYFLKASAVGITEIFVHDAGPHEANPNTDNSKAE